MPPLTVRVTYLRQIADQVVELGVDAAAWLAISGLKECDLVDAAAVVPIETFGELVANAIALTGVSGFGVLAGRRLIPGSHGILGLAAAASSHISEAMQIVARFVCLRTGVIDIRTQVTNETLKVHFVPALGLGSARNAVTEISVVAVKNIADDLFRGRSRCSEVFFEFPEPPHAALARDIFGCTVRYGQRWSGLSFPLAVAEEPAYKHDPLVLAEAMQICVDELKRLGNNKLVSTRLERVILDHLPALPALPACARLLGMSQRTLHRRLLEEETSYREVIESVRHRMALELIRRKTTVKEVAYSLGYTDIANFRRAFKRWEGVAPSEWGKQK